MSDYYATAEVWIGDLGPAEDEQVRELIEAALANYQTTVAVTVHPYPEQQ